MQAAVRGESLHVPSCPASTSSPQPQQHTRSCFRGPFWRRDPVLAAARREALQRHRSRRASQRGLHVQCQAAGLAAEHAAPGPQQRPSSGRLLALIAGAAVLAYHCAPARQSTALFAAIQATAAPLAHKGTGFASSAWAGLFAGCLHSLSGPDHLAALTPLTVGRGQLRATFLGALWGFGHCLGQLVLGLALLLLKERFHQLVPALSKYSSVTVACTLIVIGGLGLREVWQESHPAQMPAVVGAGPGLVPGRMAEVPEDMACAGLQSGLPENLRSRSSFWTLAAGVVYGLQPDALFVVIPALALPTRLAALAYMAMFVLGTMAAMGGYTAVIGATSKAIRQSNEGLLSKLAGAASSVAVLAGLVLLWPSLGLQLPFG